jgi:hypothetical protein
MERYFQVPGHCSTVVTSECDFHISRALALSKASQLGHLRGAAFHFHVSGIRVPHA